MDNVYKSAYKQLVSILEKDYERMINNCTDEPYTVSITVSELKIIENMVNDLKDDGNAD